jgi:hypothetical protein
MSNAMEVYALPAGVVYEGAPAFTAQSADGWIYAVYCGERPGKPFGTHCFKINPAQARSEWVELPVFTPTRVGVTVEPDGAYISFPTQGSNWTNIARVKIPGFIPLVGSGEPIIIEPQPQPLPPPQPTACEDEGARVYTTKVKAELKGQIAELEQRLDALALPAPDTSGLTRQDVLDILWNAPQLIDRIYAELLKRNNSGLVAELKAVAREAVMEALAETLDDE